MNPDYAVHDVKNPRHIDCHAGGILIPANVYLVDDKLIITGDPRRIWPDHDDTESPHNCDAMGCGWEHVLGRCEVEKGNK